MPLQRAQAARCRGESCLLVAREKREWMCRSEETDIVMESRSQGKGGAFSRPHLSPAVRGSDRLWGMQALPGGRHCDAGPLAVVAPCFQGWEGAIFFPHGPRPARGRRQGPRGSSTVRRAGAGELPAGIGRQRQHQHPFGGFSGAGAEGQDAAAAQTLPLQCGEQAGQILRREDAAEQTVMAQQAPGRMAEHCQRIRRARLGDGPPLAGVRAVVQRGGAAQGGVAPGTGRGSAAARQRIGRVGQDEMEGIFAAVPQKMRVGKVALPEAAHIFQPQKAGVCRGRSA